MENVIYPYKLLRDFNIPSLGIVCLINLLILSFFFQLFVVSFVVSLIVIAYHYVQVIIDTILSCFYFK